MQVLNLSWQSTAGPKRASHRQTRWLPMIKHFWSILQDFRDIEAQLFLNDNNLLVDSCGVSGSETQNYPPTIDSKASWQSSKILQAWCKIQICSRTLSEILKMIRGLSNINSHNLNPHASSKGIVSCGWRNVKLPVWLTDWWSLRGTYFSREDPSRICLTSCDLPNGPIDFRQVA